ncbi:Carbohydrate-binding family 6 protein [Pelomyxa schiedti]|nr:Carbohydrate-binding family 6 protein [Pelomyxa schiedti]
MPSFALTNWADSILTWSGPRDNPNSDPVRPTGVTSFRISADYTSSAVAQDTFALIAGDDVYDNPLLWDGDVQLYTDGEFKTFMEVYNYSSITSRYCISRSYFLPPGENFYIVQYSISNVQNKDVTVSLLDYLETPSLSCSSYEVGKYSSTDDAFTVDMTACGQQMYLVYGVFGGTKIVTSYQVGSTSGSTSPLYQFSNYGSLSNQQQFSYTSISIGTQTTVTIPAESTTVLSFYRVLMPTMSDALSVNKRVQSQTAASWILQTEKSYSDWLAIAKKPTLDPLQESLYEISLLATKNSMNPTSGSFVASFHPAYAFKVWARDATFSAMILENAGYTEEPALFLKWLAGVELRDGGMGLHTCYSWFDGNPVGFVEPQYDSSGAALLAYYLHYKITGDTTVLQYAQSRIRQLEDFFLNNVEYGGLVPPDYSIWEESSDGITGDPIPPSHFTFTQSLAYAGIWSASLIESAVFGDSQRQQQLQARSESLGNALNTLLWVEGDKGYGYFARSLDATTHLPDTRVDGSTAAAIWTGACLNKTRGSAHIERIIANLTKLDYGIARKTIALDITLHTYIP